MIHDPNLALYTKLYKHDGSAFMSDDAYGRTCTVSSVTWEVQGRNFAGGGYIDCGTIDISGAITIIVWAKVSAATDKAFVSNYNAAADTCQYQFKIATDTDNYLHYNIANAGQEDKTSTTEVSLNTWQQYAASNDLSNIHFYIQGLPAGSPATTKTPPTAGFGKTSIGRFGDFNGGYITAVIGEVRIYNRVLTPLEVQRNFLATKWRYA